MVNRGRVSVPLFSASHLIQGIFFLKAIVANMKYKGKEKNKKALSDILQGNALTRLSIIGAILLMLIIIILALAG